MHPWKLPWQVHVANPLLSLRNTLSVSVPWDQVVSAPLTIKNDVLKDACRALGEQVSGVKAVLVLRLLQYFGVKRPCAVPALVLLAVKCEKVHYSKTIANQPSDVKIAVAWAYKHFTQNEVAPAYPTMFHVRKVLASHFASMTSLLQYASRFRAQASDQLRQSKHKKQVVVRCGCGNTPAPRCQQSCCKNCCHGPCARHKR